MKIIFIILMTLSLEAQAIPIPLKTPTPQELFPEVVTIANICTSLWKYPFKKDVSLIDRLRMNDICDRLEDYPPELKEQILKRILIQEE